MNGTQAHIGTHESVTEARSSLVMGGSLLEGFGSIATIALAIVGLAGVFSPTMAAIAAIVLGAATMVEGGAFGVKAAQLSASTGETRYFEGAFGADFQGGLATVVLGILALLGVAPLTLLSVAVIALGATFLFSNRIMIGLGAAVLGILAVVGLSTLTLILVAFLVLGAGLLFTGSKNAAFMAAARSNYS
jgi:hypothetical protein